MGKFTVRIVDGISVVPISIFGPSLAPFIRVSGLDVRWRVMAWSSSAEEPSHAPFYACESTNRSDGVDDGGEAALDVLSGGLEARGVVFGCGVCGEGAADGGAD